MYINLSEALRSPAMGNWFGFNMGVSYFLKHHCILGEFPGTIKLKWEKLFSNYVERKLTIYHHDHNHKVSKYKAISYASSHFIPINILGTRKGNY